MGYVKGSEIEKAMAGSYESRLASINALISDRYVDESVSVIATFEDHAIVLVGEDDLRKVSYGTGETGAYIVTEDKPSRVINIIDEDEVDVHVAFELKKIVSSMMSGGSIPRTQVRELAPLVDASDTYWVSEIVGKIEESTNGAKWDKMYMANQEKIRTSLYGKIREIESAIPKSRYKNLPEGKISNFESEIIESIGIVKNVIDKISGDCSGLGFSEDNEFLSAIGESLIVEAQAVVGLLGKAEKLYSKDDLVKLAMVHDKLADRAKNMAVVSEYLFSKAQ